MKKRFLFLLLILTFPAVFKSQAQDYPRRTDVNLDLMVQELFDQQESDDVPYEDIYENLLQFYQNPINLNRAQREELSSLFILSEAQITALFDHITKTGGLLSIYELQSINGFDMPTIYKLMPFVTVQDAGLHNDRRSLWERIRTEENNYFLVRYSRGLQTKKGYLAPAVKENGEVNSHYLGSPDNILMRYRVSHTRDFSMGFTAEKDAGEQFIWDEKTRRYGFDFYSAHFHLYDKGRFRSIAIGDYQLQFGQGLVAASGFGVGKGSETITTVRRSNIGVRPYSSTLEASFYRGAAATYALTKTIDITGFYSNKRVEASINLAVDTLDQLAEQLSLSDIESSTIQITGFHRTPSEIARKNNIREQVYGSNISYNSVSRNFSAGFTVLNSGFSVPLRRDDAVYNKFEFQGKNNLIMSTFYSYNWRNVNFFGEAARSQNGGIGLVQGLMASLSSKVEMALLYRNYAKDFHSLYGNAFAESTRPINEQGFYTGLKIRPVSRWEVTAYYDRFSFPWIKYGLNAPSRGDEYLVRALYKPSKVATIYGQFRVENKEKQDAKDLRNIPGLTVATRRNFTLSADFSPSRLLSLRSRVQFSNYTISEVKTTGYLVAQDVVFDLGKVKISTRYAIFDTEDFNNAQYITEKDVLYAVSIPAFSGIGTRTYLLLNYSVNRHLDLWGKIALTHYRYDDAVSSGLEEIEGNHRTDVRLQMRYRF